MRVTGKIWMNALVTGCFFCPTMASAAEPTPGEQVEQEFKSDDGSLSYLLYLPKDYKDNTDKVPLILFLHGRGESYGPLRLVEKWGPPRMVARGDEMPYILVSPQCPGTTDWRKPEQQILLAQLLDHIIKQFRVNEERVYLTGLSMGGYGSWQLAATHPDRFAAVAPICGGGDPEKADRLKSLPIWVFHGDQDEAVPLQRSEEMVSAIRAAGSTTVRFTTLEDVGHNSWSAAYATPELYGWFDKQTRSQNRERAGK